MAKQDKAKSKKVTGKASYAFLKNLINMPSPTGFEWNGQKLWLDYIKAYTDEQFTDPYGSAAAVINPGAPFKVVLEAHADEISWFVNYITAEGLIYLKRNGGVDHQIAPAKRVIIHGRKGPVKAVFGWPAIHTRLSSNDSKEPAPRVDNLFLDCGARSKKDVESLGLVFHRLLLDGLLFCLQHRQLGLQELSICGQAYIAERTLHSAEQEGIKLW